MSIDHWHRQAGWHLIHKNPPVRQLADRGDSCVVARSYRRLLPPFLPPFFAERRFIMRVAVTWWFTRDHATDEYRPCTHLITKFLCEMKFFISSCIIRQCQAIATVENFLSSSTRITRHQYTNSAPMLRINAVRIGIIGASLVLFVSS